MLNRRLTKKGESDPSYLLLNEISAKNDIQNGPRAVNATIQEGLAAKQESVSR